MYQLIPLLEDIIKAEYSQWMRYIYLSALGFGISTDSFAKHLYDHGNEELSHAEIITRWLVDFGGMPVTDFKSIDPYSISSVNDAADWLILHELEGIEKYNILHAMAGELGLFGLQYDVSKIISSENEHVSDLENYVSPHMVEGDSLIVVAKACYKANPIIRKNAQVLYVTDPLAILSGLLQESLHEHGKNYTPEIGYNEALDKIVNEINYFWEDREHPYAKQQLDLYNKLYKFMTQDSIRNGWEDFHNVKLMPEWYEWAINNGEGGPYQFEKNYDKMFDEMEKQDKSDTLENIMESEETENRRPIIKEIEKEIKIYNPDTNRKDMTATIGDYVYNSTNSRDILRNYETTKQNAQALSTGRIEDINDKDNTILVSVDTDEEGFDKQWWNYKTDKIYKSREKGKRVVNT